VRLNWPRAQAVADAIVTGWSGDRPGGAILLFDRDGVRHEASGGLADLSRLVAFTGATPTRYASLTKNVFCAFTLARQLDPRLVLGRALPGLAPALAAVPVFRALSMTGGLPDLSQSATLLGLPYTAMIETEAADRFTDALPALDCPPGVELSYSNTGYRLVERALAAQGAPFGPWVETTLNRGLGTGFRFPSAWDQPIAGLAQGYWRETAENAWRIGAYGVPLSASGALIGSGYDLVAWLGALLRGKAPVFDALNWLAAPTPLTDGRYSAYGLGLATTEIDGVEVIGHGGSLPGFKNQALMHVATGVGVVVLTNHEEADANGLAQSVIAALFDRPFPPAPAEPGALPEGLFMDPRDCGWIEYRAGVLTYLGASSPLFAGAVAGEVTTRSYTLPITLRRERDAIAGETGYRKRRFLPVPADAPISASLVGVWRERRWGAVLEIARDGTAAFGLGPLRRVERLTSLGRGRALLPVGAPPWPMRAGLRVMADGTLAVTSNRSRIWRFTRN
jgi:CubicO group peptidase (beta-lactamase class C family)